jgi:RimJ/RimL family protein N-acetyltransferase
MSAFMTGDSAIEMLRIEAQVLMRADRFDRPDGPSGIRLFVASDGCFVTASRRLPGNLARELEGLLGAHTPDADASSEPDGSRACFERLSCFGQVEVKSGPSYLIPGGRRFTTAVSIVDSDAPAAWLEAANPGNWAADEWSCLISGELGPWAMAEVNNRVVSICHTSAVIPGVAAECGTWTDPGYRGRGYAAAATVRWSSLAGGLVRYLFYSTSAGNLSSQRVAARLGLPKLGWSWAWIARPAAPTR